MTEVLRLAVAAVEAGEYAQDLGRALRGERRIDTREAGRVEALVIKPAAHVAAEQRDLERFWHIDPRVLQQRRQVVGGRPHHRILKVENADARDVVPPRKPQKVGRMK